MDTPDIYYYKIYNGQPTERIKSINHLQRERAGIRNDCSIFLSFILDINLEPTLLDYTRQGVKSIFPDQHNLTIPELVLFEGYNRIFGSDAGYEFLNVAKKEGYSLAMITEAAKNFINMSRLHEYVYTSSGAISPFAKSWGIEDEAQVREHEGTAVARVQAFDITRYACMGDLTDPQPHGLLTSYLIEKGFKEEERSIGYTKRPIQVYQSTKLGIEPNEDLTKIFEYVQRSANGEIFIIPGTVEVIQEPGLSQIKLKENNYELSHLLASGGRDNYTLFSLNTDRGYYHGAY